MVFVKNKSELVTAIENEVEEIVVIEEFVGEIKSIADFRYLSKEERDKLIASENLIMMAMGLAPICAIGLAFSNLRNNVLEVIKDISPQSVKAFMDVFDVMGFNTVKLLKNYEIVELQLDGEGYIRLKVIS